MPVVPFIPAIISGGFGLLAAHEQASANKDAAQTQTDAMNRALDIAQQQYEQQRADLAGYRAMGNAAVGRLGYGLGLPGFESGSAPAAPAAPDAPGGPLAPNNVIHQQLTPPQQSALTDDAYRNLQQQFQSSDNWGEKRQLAQMGADFLAQRQAAGHPYTLAGLNPYMTAGQRAAGGGSVTLRAPTGETQTFNASDPRVQQALNKGAVRV